MSARRRLTTRQNCLPEAPEPLGLAPGPGTVPEAVTAAPPRVVAVVAEARGGPAGTTGPGVPWTALAAAAVLHAACLATTLSFVRSVPPPAAAAVEQVAQMAFVPAAVATPAEAAVATEAAAAAAAPEPEAASSAPEAAAPGPTTAVEPDQPDAPPSPEPVAAPPVVAAQAAEAPEEQPAEAPATSDTATAPLVTAPEPAPGPTPAQRQPRLPAARPVKPAQVAPSRGGTPAHGPRENNIAVVAAEAGAAGREAGQGPAHYTEQEAGLEAGIRDAVQAAVRYPAAARMMEVTGRARVQLDYRNGTVGGTLLAQSSGTPMLDQAALSAAQGAHYPATPPALAGRLMRFLVWVEFRTG